MAQKSDHESIKEALSKGRLSVLDPTTGYQKAIRGRCPDCGFESEAYKWDKMGDEISRVTFNCPSCGKYFQAAPEEMVLR